MSMRKLTSLLSPLSSLLSLYKRQPQPSIDTKHDHQQRLHGVDDEHEVERLVGLHAVEDEHGLHSKMPGTGAVGSGHDDGNAAHHKRDHGARQTQMGREVEAEEGQVVVQEVAHPDAY